MNELRNVFVSYSRKDKDYCLNLIQYLQPLEKEGLISIWFDGEIAPGVEWNMEIMEHINNADIILLLISIDFINSDYIAKVELERAMQRHKAQEARVIPIIIRPVSWENQPFAILNVLPEGAKAVALWDNIDVAYLNISQEIRNAIYSLKPKSIIGGEGLSLHNDTMVVAENYFPKEEYYKFYGLKGLRPGPIVQDFVINRNDDQKELNLNPVQYLWADVFSGSTITSYIIQDKRYPNLRIYFDHKGGWGCNIAIRPQCELACHNEKRWKYLTFEARIPSDELISHPDYLREVGISVRIVNARMQHWEYAIKPSEYIIKSVEDTEWGGGSIQIDLADKRKWHIFANDGNFMPTGEKADFSVIAGVILKFGKNIGMPGEPSPGKGVIDIRALRLTD